MEEGNTLYSLSSGGEGCRISGHFFARGKDYTLYPLSLRVERSIQFFHLLSGERAG